MPQQSVRHCSEELWMHAPEVKSVAALPSWEGAPGIKMCLVMQPSDLGPQINT